MCLVAHDITKLYWAVIIGLWGILGLGSDTVDEHDDHRSSLSSTGVILP
jgi:hypothetical protein